MTDKLRCPNCKRDVELPFEAKWSNVGQLVTCPHCRTELELEGEEHVSSTDAWSVFTLVAVDEG